MIDHFCISLIGSACAIVFILIGYLSADVARGVSIVAYFSISIGYGLLTEWLWRGQTIGKRVLGLRVIDAQGLRLQFSQIVIRNLLRSVDMLPLVYLVGGVAMAVSRRGQRLGDIAANTVVVRNPRVPEPDLSQILPDKYNSLREHPHLEARLRQRVKPEEAGIALRALLRRDELDPQARVELFRDIASHFRSLASFPPEATESLADEQYVRNVVDVVFRARRHPAGGGTPFPKRQQGAGLLPRPFTGSVD